MYDEKCLSRVGRNARALRLAVQMGQEELAERLGVSQTHMSNMECGRVTTSIKGLLKLANIFNCSLDVLLDKKAALKLAAQRAEAYIEEADEDGETELIESEAEDEAEAEGQPAAENSCSSAEAGTGGVYSWEEVRQLLELLHKAPAGVSAGKAVQQKQAAASAQGSKGKTTDRSMAKIREKRAAKITAESTVKTTAVTTAKRMGKIIKPKAAPKNIGRQPIDINEQADE